MDGSDILILILVTLITGAVADVPIILLSIRWAVKHQLRSLPGVLDDPATQLAMRQFIAKASKMGSGSFSRAVGAPIGAALSKSLQEAMEKGFSEAEAQMSAKIMGQIGGSRKGLAKAMGVEKVEEIGNMVSQFRTLLNGGKGEGPGGGVAPPGGPLMFR